MHRLILPLSLLICMCICTGCSTQPGRMIAADADIDLASQPTIYWNDWVRKGAPQIFVSPDRAAEHPPTALFVPLRVTQKMEHANAIGYNLSRIVWQTWLQAGALPTIEFADGAPPYRPDLALAYARQRKADLVIGGTINYFTDGGTVGDSAISISLEIYDVKSGTLLWSFGQAALMQVGKVGDYLLFATRSRLPTDPATACLTAVATDLATMVRGWAYNVPPKKGGALQPKAF